MPNQSYQRSVKRERALVNKLRNEGYFAARSAGSKSPFDVYAFNPHLKQVLLVQIKTQKGKTKEVIKHFERFENINVHKYTLSYE